ncbi:MAG: 1-(5-phosphoribosyl)-5-[(5-phosphoribosylamino)methylideneamino]imidazole-4-carboxamide isomerase [Bacteroidetes bacterium]|nr:1-(5-phosphoribosyl)-5-[(5-phosphoribosylamino)methylideneamino]imidazole-4-carboxamide isomerase [Bacteroidota bacterium]
MIFKRAEELRNNLTPSETLLWNYLGQGQLGIKFRRQHPASVYVLDFYAHKIKLAIEIDGSIHSLEEVKRNDLERQDHLESLGISFLRFTNEQVLTNLESVIEKIKREMSVLLSASDDRGKPTSGHVGKRSPSGAGGLGFNIIPAIDIIDGKCVRLTQGDYAQKKVYNDNPLEVALMFEDIGIKRLHLVDLDGAKKGTVINLKVLETIASKTKLVIDFGGGIKTDKDIQNVYDAGANIATIGSIAVKDKELFFSWLHKYGTSKILLGADVKNEKIAVGGWLETTDVSVFDFIKENMEQGVKDIFCTDISKDGLLQGPSIDLYKSIIQQFPKINLIASGGVAEVKDLEELKKIGCSGAIVGKAIYEERITIDELKKFI